MRRTSPSVSTACGAGVDTTARIERVPCPICLPGTPYSASWSMSSPVSTASKKASRSAAVVASWVSALHAPPQYTVTTLTAESSGPPR